MKFRFIGTYTNGHTGISILGHDFVGHQPTDVSEDAAVRLSRHPEFEEVLEITWSVVDDPNDFTPVAPKRRGRPKKAAV